VACKRGLNIKLKVNDIGLEDTENGSCNGEAMLLFLSA